MKIPNSKEMREIDHISTEKYLIPSIILMENAGLKITQKILLDLPEISNSRPLILIGPGNNGGDAFVIARELYNNNIYSNCVFIGNKEDIKGNSKINFDILNALTQKDLDFSIIFVIKETDWNKVKKDVLTSKILIDGLFGTGFTGEAKGIYKSIITDINKEYNGKILSIDVPSGLICENTPQSETIIKANKTYTIALPKIGMIDYPGKSYTGEIEIVPIGFPKELLTSLDIKTELVTTDLAQNIKPNRNPDTHKGDYGNLLVIAGNSKYHGAAHLTSMSAFTSGAGLVTLASVPSVCNSLKSKTSEIITFTFSDTDSDEFEKLMDIIPEDHPDREIAESFLRDEEDRGVELITDECFNEIKPELKKYSVCVVGPGIGKSETTAFFLDELIMNFTNPLVIDADALNIIAKDIDNLKKLKSTSILTPHIKEFSRLIKKNVKTVTENKSSLALSFAKKYKVILVLKDAVTIITDGENIYYNSTGNAGLARGGSGDVLSGIIGAMVARGLSQLNAAIFGVYLHGLVADIIAREMGIEGVTPQRIIDNMHKGFLYLQNNIDCVI